MAAEIGTHDAELEELMAQLEAETGVTIAPSPAPVAAPAPVVTTPMTAVVETAAATPATSTHDDELLAELEAGLEVVATPAPVAAAAPVSASGLVSAPVATVVTPEPALSPEDELAALEAELSSETAVLASSVAVNASMKEAGIMPGVTALVDDVVKKAAHPIELDERGMSFIPGAVLVDPKTEPKPLTLEEAAPILVAGTTTTLAAEKPSIPDPKEAFKLDDPVDPMSGMAFYTDPQKFRLETSISDHDLDRCFMEQNGLFSHYAANAAKAEAQHGRLKLKADVLEAKLYEEERRIAAEEGEKVTEKMLENRVKSNPVWLKAKLAVVDASGVADINKGLTESLRHRKDMLVQMGADRRGEMQGQARMMNASAAMANESDRARLAAQAAFQK